MLSSQEECPPSSSSIPASSWPVLRACPSWLNTEMTCPFLRGYMVSTQHILSTALGALTLCWTVAPGIGPSQPYRAGSVGTKDLLRLPRKLNGVTKHPWWTDKQTAAPRGDSESFDFCTVFCANWSYKTSHQ